MKDSQVGELSDYETHWIDRIHVDAIVENYARIRTNYTHLQTRVTVGMRVSMTIEWSCELKKLFSYVLMSGASIPPSFFLRAAS